MYKVWGTHDWSKVIWTNESAFTVGGAPGRVWVTRRVEEEFHKSFLLPKFKKHELVMVRGWFVGRHKGPLIIWDKGAWGMTMNAKGYQTQILPHLERFWQSESARIQDYVYIQQDNASPHRVLSTITDLQEHGLYNYRLPWPATSPDLNLIETIWRLMKVHISNLIPHAQNNHEMIEALRTQWDAITEYDLGQILDIMIDRVDALVSVNGGPTKF